jgi:hypothetical protein
MALLHQQLTTSKINGERPLNKLFKKISERLLAALNHGLISMKLTVMSMRMASLRNSLLKSK